ncbi:MAG: tetratricopeptide repeat protein [Planctomycetes bacterium]|nr:tetratricopeptide repeat protein [Planctomycetota bacterium]
MNNGFTVRSLGPVHPSEPARPRPGPGLLLSFALIALVALPVAADDKSCWELFRGGSYEEAVPEFRREIRKYPKSFELLDGLGWCHYYLRQYASAEEMFRQALALNPAYDFSKQGIDAITAWRWQDFNRALSYYSAQSYESAECLFLLIERDRSDRFPKSDRWRLDQMIGWCLLFRGESKEAEARFQTALKTRGESGLLRGLARAQIAQGTYDKALATLARLQKAEKLTASDQVLLGWARLGHKDAAAAAQAFKGAVTAESTNAEAHLGLGLAHARDGNVAGAKAEFSTAVDLSPWMSENAEFAAVLAEHADWRDLRCRIGWAWYRFGYAAAAQTAFSAAVALAPLDPEARTGLGFALYGRGYYGSALAELDRALAGPGQHPFFEMAVPTAGSGGTSYTIRADAASLRAWCFLKKGQSWAAVPAFEEVVRKNPDWVDAWCGLGWSRYAAGSLDSAREAFEKAATLAPSHPDASDGLAALDALRTAAYDRAVNSYSAGDYAGARLTLKGELDRLGDSVPAAALWALQDLLGWCFVRLGRAEEALPCFEAALKSMPLDAGTDPWFGRASALHDLGRYDDALAAIEKMGDRESRPGEARLLAAWCLWGAGEAELAGGAFEEIVGASPTSSSALLGLGLCREKAGRAGEAVALFRKALAISPALLDGERLRSDPLRMKCAAELQAAAGWGWYYAGYPAAACTAFGAALERGGAGLPIEMKEETQTGYGLSLSLAGDPLKAISILHREVSKLPPMIASWSLGCDAVTALARSQRALGKIDEAATTYSRLLAAVKSIDAYPDLHAELGGCHLDLGAYDQAANEFLEALRLSPENATALAGLKRLAVLRPAAK